MKFRLLDWAMSDNKEFLEKQIKELESNGFIVEIRKLINKEFKYGLYIKKK